MEVPADALVRIHNLPPMILADGEQYKIGDELPIGLLRETFVDPRVLIGYFIAGRLRPAQARLTKYPHGGMDGHLAAAWAIGHDPSGAVLAPKADELPITPQEVEAIETAFEVIEPDIEEIEFGEAWDSGEPVDVGVSDDLFIEVELPDKPEPPVEPKRKLGRPRKP